MLVLCNVNTGSVTDMGLLVGKFYLLSKVSLLTVQQLWRVSTQQKFHQQLLPNPNLSAAVYTLSFCDILAGADNLSPVAC